MKRDDQAGRSPARWARYVRQSPIELAASEYEAIVGVTGLQVYARNLSTSLRGRASEVDRIEPAVSDRQPKNEPSRSVTVSP